MKKGSSLLILAPVWPGLYSGHAIAFLSTIESFIEKFDVINYVVALRDISRPTTLPHEDKINYHCLELTRHSELSRFVGGLFSKTPAFCRQFSNTKSQQVFASLFGKLYRDSDPDMLFVEHLPVFSILPHNLAFRLRSRTVVRSHDMLFDAFSPFARTRGLKSVAWEFELFKIKRYELAVAQHARVFATISEGDSLRYFAFYNIKPQFILGVFVPFQNLFDIPIGGQKTVLHIGGMDMRKKGGLWRLVYDIWPNVVSRVPDASLVLVGAASDSFSNPRHRIRGMGVVNDVAEFYRDSAVFVNPQETGSGVKIKSLNALAAGRILVSSENGVTGIAVKDREHCLIARNPDQLICLLIEVLLATNDFTDMAKRGRELVIDSHAMGNITKHYSHLITSVI